MGGAEYAKLGTPKNSGTRIFGISGHIKRPGLYELPLGLPLDFILNELAGGSSTGKKIKAVIPGGRAKEQMQNHFDSQVCLCDWLKSSKPVF